MNDFNVAIIKAPDCGCVVMIYTVEHADKATMRDVGSLARAGCLIEHVPVSVYRTIATDAILNFGCKRDMSFKKCKAKARPEPRIEPNSDTHGVGAES